MLFQCVVNVGDLDPLLKRYWTDVLHLRLEKGAAMHVSVCTGNSNNVTFYALESLSLEDLGEKFSSLNGSCTQLAILPSK